MNKKINITVAITAIIIIAGILAGITYFINRNQETNNPIKKQNPTPIATSTENNLQNSETLSINNKCSADSGSPEQMLCKLAKALRSGNEDEIMSYFDPTSKKTGDIREYGQPSKNKLADSFDSCNSKERHSDYIIYECAWTTKNEEKLMLEMTVAKGPNDKWIVTSW